MVPAHGSSDAGNCFSQSHRPIATGWPRGFILTHEDCRLAYHIFLQYHCIAQGLLEFGGDEILPLIGNAIEDLFFLVDDAAPGGAVRGFCMTL